MQQNEKNNKVKKIKAIMQHESITLPLLCNLLNYNYKSLSQIFAQTKNGMCNISDKKLNRIQEKIQQIIGLKDVKNINTTSGSLYLNITAEIKDD